MFKKILANIIRHKVISTVVVLVVAIGGVYGYKKITVTSAETQYVLAAVTRETLITSISGSGQVSASNQIDLKPKASVDVIRVAVVSGQEVKAGDVVAQLDSTDAAKAIRDAQSSLQSAKLSLQKLQQPADALSLIQAENNLAKAQETKSSAEDNLLKAYDDGYNDVSGNFLSLPTVMSGLQNVLFGIDISSNGQWNIDYYMSSIEKYDDRALAYRDDAYIAYQLARQYYDKNFSDYKATSRYADQATIESLISQTYETTKKIAEAIKSANNLIQFYNDTLAQHDAKTAVTADTHLSSLSSYTATTNTHLQTLLGDTNGIKSYRDAITSAERSINESTESLAKIKSGTDALDLESSRLTVTQRENALRDAQNQYADYTVRAPFDGTIAKVSVKKYDSA